MNIKDVENLAKLARIDLSEEEKIAMLKDMESILHYVRQIEEVKASNGHPEYDLRNVWREDDVTEKEFDRDLLTGQFPDSKGGFLKVKKIL